MLFVNVPAAYPAILLAAVAINVQCLLTGFIAMGIARREYKIEYPSLDGPKGFQNYVRAHQNFVEGIAPVTVLLLVAGLAEPTVWVAFSAGGAYFIGRILYAWGYARSENNGEGRIPGVVLIDLALLTMFGLAIYSCVLMATTQA